MLASLLALALFADAVPPRTPTPDWVTPELVPALATTGDGGAGADGGARPDGGLPPDGGVSASDGGGRSDGGVEGPVAWLLSDLQVRATPKSLTTWTHYAWRVQTRAGIDELASRTISWDPTSESLAVHGVQVHRGGRRIDAWFPADARVYARESRLEERIYDGRVSLTLELRDVRVGDVVELDYSVTSSGDVFGGRYQDLVDQRFSVPVERAAWRLVWERPTTVAVRVSAGGTAPRTTKRGAVTELAWRADHLTPLTIEQDLPPDVDPWPTVELSEWASWDEVAAWATRLFVVNQKRSPLLEKELERLAALPSTDARAHEAVRFVQDDLRYLGFELGPNSYRPHAPDWVLERRFGDCKDKSLLLVGLLRGLGVDAWPALVNTSRGAALGDVLPSPLHFNHAIVLVRLDGKDVWVDPTIALQRGPLGRRAGLDYRRALVVRPGTRALSELPFDAPTEPDHEVEQRWAWPARGGPATLVVTTRLLGAQADALRALLSESSRDDLGPARLDFRQRLDPKLSQTQPLTVADDPEANVLTLVEHYALPEFLDDEARHVFEPVSLNARVREPREVGEPGGSDEPSVEEGRTLPFALPHPVHVRERIVFDGPSAVEELDATPRSASLPGLEASLQVTHRGNHVELEYRARSTADRVAPADLPRYLKGRREMFEWAAFHLYLPEADAPRGGGGDTLGSVVAGGLCILAVLFFVGLAVWERTTTGGTSFRHWRRGRRFKGLLKAADGEAPATALAVRDEAEVTERMPPRCASGHPLSAPPVKESELLLDGERITPWSRTCPACGSVERRYFRER